MTDNNSATPPVWVDPDEAPELDDAFFARATLRNGDKVVRRGRPPVLHAKAPVKLRLDQDVLAALRASGPGWQTRINALLREALANGQLGKFRA